MTYTADTVWGLAVRAFVLNKGYCKQSGYSFALQDTVVANKILVKSWLVDGVVPTDDEIAVGKTYREFFDYFLVKIMNNTITQFEQAAFEVSRLDSFKSNQLTEIAIVSVLPKVASEGEFTTLLDYSKDITTKLEGDVGSSLTVDIKVLKCVTSQAYNKCRITALIGDTTFVDFWNPNSLVVGNKYNIYGRIKEHRKDNTTQLNYVKINRTYC